MNISWVLSDQITLDPTVDVKQLKNIGSLWGGWRTWRACQTDNVICNDMQKANELIQRDFHRCCNLHISNIIYQNLGRPEHVILFEGEFKHDVDHQDEIIAMHLAAANSDIVLMLGFDLSKKNPHADKLVEHTLRNYRGLVRQAILNNDQAQWVVVDHIQELHTEYAKLPNITCDTLNNILENFEFDN
jgi:hypothetical protein